MRPFHVSKYSHYQALTLSLGEQSDRLCLWNNLSPPTGFSTLLEFCQFLKTNLFC